MSPTTQDSRRTIGLLGATGVGIGAIVGGGILVLAGVAFAATGPSAIVAFGVNGVIALLTALSYAEMSTTFPESGGAYTFAKKVLSVRAAFAVGWVLWFAYIVAGVLYALGFAEYAAAIVVDLLQAVGVAAPPWITSRQVVVGAAILATAGYTLSLIRTASGGGQWATVGKVVVFVVLILAGIWALGTGPLSVVHRGMTPFLAHGPLGLLSAMGFTFIALQGFDLIGAIAGEIREPRRVIPRAMLISLGAALIIYLPLLFLVSTVGLAPGESVAAMGESRPETMMAHAVRNYLGPVGYWLVMIAAVLSTLSALQANLLAASRVALSMARDRTLPGVFARAHATRGTPVMAIYASALALVAILMMVPDLAAAGAAASLIFLVSFALAHMMSFLARRRAAGPAPDGRASLTEVPKVDAYRTPYFPAVQVVGGVACAAMAVFQAVAVPAAGQVTAVWLGLGVILYYSLFASRAKAVDAFAEAVDPELAQMRGRSPLVLVPVANPESAPAMVAIANAVAPPRVGRVLLLTVMRRPAHPPAPGELPVELVAAQRAVGEALAASLADGHSPEVLLTVASAPWKEIARVARVRRCESLLLGLSRLAFGEGGGCAGPRPEELEALLNEVDCDVAILRAPSRWRLEHARRIVVPMGGRGDHDLLRARLLGSLCRTGEREVTFVRVLPADSSDHARAHARQQLLGLAAEEAPPGAASAEILCTDDVVAALAGRAQEGDLLVLGLERHHGKKLFGRVALRIARETASAAIMLSRRG